ncbi:MAG: NAD(P)-dependent oxidoreductase [Bacteroidales bacterium]
MKSLKKNIWIFGGTGFIGDALVKKLSENENNRLHLLLHKNRPFKSLEHTNTFTGSLQDFDPAWFLKYPPDVIFHLARPAGGNHLSRSYAARSGLKANRKIIHILRDLYKPPVIVYVSGSLMFGTRDKETPAMEDSALAPVSFAASYFRLESPWIEAGKNEILDVRMARPGWIVGPSSWFVEFFWKPYLVSGKVPFYGDGNQQMSVIHLEDCAGLIASLGNAEERYRSLNIFCGPIVTQNEFSAQMAGLLNTETTRIPFNKIVRKYGRTVSMALTSSIPMGTIYNEIYNHYSFKYPDLKSILVNIIGILKNKQEILSKTP